MKFYRSCIVAALINMLLVSLKKLNIEHMSMNFYLKILNCIMNFYNSIDQLKEDDFQQLDQYIHKKLTEIKNALLSKFCEKHFKWSFLRNVISNLKVFMFLCMVYYLIFKIKQFIEKKYHT